MVKNTCLVLYGNSVFLAGIQAELQRYPALELITIHAGSPDVLEQIRKRKPRAVLFDLNIAQPDFAFPLLREQPDVRMIGVDSSSDEILVLASRLVRVRGVHDLMKLILADSVAPE